MVKYKKNGTRSFQSVNGRNLAFDLQESQGCLCVSITNELKLLSYKIAFFLGFAICGMAFRNSIIDSFYTSILFVLFLLFIMYESLFFVEEEKILIVKGLGYQIGRKFPIRNTTSFIPYERVQKIFINEVVLKQRVVYILSLVVQEDFKQHKLVPLFKDILPRLDCLEIMYRNIKSFEDS